MYVARYYIEPIVDYKIHGTSPVENIPVFKAAYKLNVRRAQILETQYQYNQMQDSLYWFNLLF
jgi:hypothetical protein